MIDRREVLRYGIAAGATVAAGLGSGTSLAQTAWPDKPVRVIVAFPAGGASDVLTRMLCERLSERFKQQFIIENRTGAGGNIGMAVVSGAKNDSSIIASATIGTLSINQYLYSRLGYDPEKDFAYVSTIWENCGVFAVSGTHPAKTLAEFRTWALAQPNGVTFSSSGIGTTPHLAGELFGQRTGIKVTHVPFRGSASTEVIGGRIDFSIDNIASYTPLLQSGLARALAVTSADRWPIFPTVPTMAEAGVPDFILTSWGAFVMPAGTPPAVTAALSQAIHDIASQPAMKERFLAAGARAVSSTPAELVAYAAAERIKWKELIRLAKVEKLD